MSYLPRHAQCQSSPMDTLERGIAREQLISTQARKRHFDAGLGGSLRDKISIDSVHSWLVHRSKRVGQAPNQVGFAEGHFNVFGTVMFSNPSGDVSFVEL